MAYTDKYIVEFSDDKKILVHCWDLELEGEYAIPDGVTKIGHGAFSDCTLLTSIVIPDSVTKIERYAFCNCISLTSIVIPDSVMEIGKLAFGSCTSLTSIEVKGFNEKYDSRENCNAIIETETNRLIVGCSNTIIPDSVIEVGKTAFCFCESLISINIPEGVVRIGEGAFCACTMLTSIVIPNSVTEIGENAFLDCSSLVKICLHWKTAIPKVFDFDEESYAKVTLYIPLGTAKLYRQVSPWNKFKHVVQYDDSKATEYVEKEPKKEETIRMEQKIIKPEDKSHYLFFDTETIGLPAFYNAPVTDSRNWPRLVQIGWIVTDLEGKELRSSNYIIYPNGFTIPQGAADVHGITTEIAKNKGVDLKKVMEEFFNEINKCKVIVGHNLDFDKHIVGAELHRLGFDYSRLMTKSSICTMLSSINYCKLLPLKHGEYKWPKLQELHDKLFGFEFEDAHDAMADISATKKCFFELKKRGII